MGIPTVRSDDETKTILKQVPKQTGWSVSTTFVALFDPQGPEHRRCKEILHAIREVLFTIIPVASVIVAAESLRTTKVFTLDLADFQRSRIRRGHRR
jgi:hypothetical protein